ncbi:Protein transport protein sec24 [Cryoendolithus antarcticus]|uniref:Protein transport protein SEC24 n=1 Tax=Cryoendolithus antarcticus TaxID=1507870 RepID=A0A1V8TJ18_9PEZI|nr:Protein transport protein sec24 [Cryoendolithus antarcticus]
MTTPYQDDGQQQWAAEGQADEGYADSAATTAVPAGGKKKRAYAGQAYEFGAGGNAAPGGQGAAGAQPPAAVGYGGAAGYGAAPVGAASYGQPASYGGQQVPYGAPGSADPNATPIAQPAGYGQPQYGQPQPLYEAPQQGYPVQTPGVAGVTQQFGQMGVGAQPLPAAQQPGLQGGLAPAQRLNPLVPVDISAQGAPFHVSDLDLPPPPIILPPNSSVTPSPHSNCPPKYVRSTLNAMPTTSSLLKKSKLPFALIIQPYATLHDAEDDVPVQYDQVIARCRRCRTYINPFASFLDHSHRWRCNMCNLTNDVPQSFDWDGAKQQSVDRWQRPELNYAVSEFVAPQEYMVRAPQPLIYLFIFDVSYAGVTSGLLATSARCILESLDRIPNTDRRTRLGFMAVDSSLHYFQIPRDEGESSDSRMLVVSDLDEPFLPTPDDLLVNLSEARSNIETFLGRLQGMFASTQNSGSAMGSALRAGHKLISHVGGKMVVLSASLPNTGFGKLDMREDKKLLGTSKENALLQTQNSFYKSFAVECSKTQVSIDMFLFSAQYQDVASLSNLPRYTGGQTYFYPAWNAARTEDAIKFGTEFSDYLSAEIGLEAVLRVRTTTGLRPSAFYGNFFNRSSDLCAFPAMPRDQAYVVEIAIDESVTKAFACLQVGVLHTTCNGERRIRVLTLSIPTTQNLAEVYASADQQAITAYFAHKAVERALSSGLDAARDAVQAKMIELLQTYRKELGGGNMGGGGLQFPGNLRGMPMLFLGLMKNLGLRKSAQIPTDLRSAALCLLSTLPLPLLMQYIYPRLYSLHDMPDDAGLPHPDHGAIVMPPALNLTSGNLVPYGLYLLDDGQTQFLWLGRDAVPALINDVFGTGDKNALKQGKTSLPVLDSEMNERVRAVVEKSRDHRGKGCGSVIVPPLYLIREDGEPSLRLWAQTLLVEDRADQGVSGAQFLGVLREKVVS